MKEHKHEPDLLSATLAEVVEIHDNYQEVDESFYDLMLDVNCKICGTSGSFIVRFSLKDINW